MNGAYELTLKTPMGMQHGRLELWEESGELVGCLTAMGKRHPFRGGRCNGNNFAFGGILRNGLINLRYNARGFIDGSALFATADTKYGVFQIEGRRSSAR